MYTATGYHTFEHREAQTIEMALEIAPVKGKGANQWLGEGYYFWVDNYERALKWGRDHYRSKRFRILEAKITCRYESIFDFQNNAEHRKMFETYASILKKRATGHPNLKARLAEITGAKVFASITTDENFLEIFKASRCCEDFTPGQRTDIKFNLISPDYIHYPIWQICVYESHLEELLNRERILEPKP